MTYSFTVCGLKEFRQRKSTSSSKVSSRAVPNDLALDDLLTVAFKVAAKNVLRVLLCAPFGATTWDAAERYGADVCERYWRKVIPHWSRFTLTEWRFLVERLLKARTAA